MSDPERIDGPYRIEDWGQIVLEEKRFDLTRKRRDAEIEFTYKERMIPVRVATHAAIAVLTVAIIAVLLWYTAVVMNDPSASNEAKNAAFGIWGATVGALLTYLAGLHSK